MVNHIITEMTSFLKTYVFKMLFVQTKTPTRRIGLKVPHLKSVLEKLRLLRKNEVAFSNFFRRWSLILSLFPYLSRKCVTFVTFVSP